MVVKAFTITSESSDVDVFCNSILGYNACSNSNRLVSDFEPAIETVDEACTSESCSDRFTISVFRYCDDGRGRGWF